MTEKTFNDYASAGADQLDDYDFAPHDYNYGFSLNDGKWETYLIAEWHNLEPVSYTHLTLPTSDLV